MRWFGRRNRFAPKSLSDLTFRCRTCEVEHDGMFDLACNAPDHWPGDQPREPNSALRLDGDFLSDDFCVINGEDFFVRCVFELPVAGLMNKFGYGVWSTLSRTNFEKYVAAFDDARPGDLGPWWGWLSNDLKTWPETRNIGCWVYPQLDRQRPVVVLDDPEHPLSIAQDVGISVERLMAIYAAEGHGPANQY
ncbi:DUF2199 domain-containing protein [Sphingomonas sp. MA1305]|uniref:DUF2199 domain-containing protein n=1 Tax=Sphingomonas sp. MA1305 TaxID=2479204 RepID=UPI0018DFA1FA|nr:DUF2199 domain-containing protein [Sphingomonas sp. MA1305]MBI0475694.1 DUF2199 domain-containing protein [Sphingomonas sp. MA1305]